MGFAGLLEDLGLRDILQLLSLSKKSGILTLENQTDSGRIVFSEGQIIRASSSQLPQGLGQLLKQEGMITSTQLQQALHYQRDLGRHKAFGEIATELFQVPTVGIERIIARQIERIVISFFSWGSGRFSFVMEDPESYGNARLNPLDFMLEKGLSPQRLALKGQHYVDRKSLDEASLELELAELDDRQRKQGLDLLRGMLAELKYPEMGGGIILLILRYASEIMHRAVVFDVRKKRLAGLGQFGIDSFNTRADETVRKMRLTIEKGSLFSKVLEKKQAIIQNLGDTAGERLLLDFLGPPQGQAFLAPLLNDGRVVALLYGEIDLDARNTDRLKTFEVFLSQAGLAMEQALLG